MIKTRTTICKGKGWRVEQEHFDYQTGKHASLKAYRYFNFSEEVSVLIEAIGSDLKPHEKGQTNAAPSTTSIPIVKDEYAIFTIIWFCRRLADAKCDRIQTLYLTYTR
jgi:hypothetical protein